MGLTRSVAVELRFVEDVVSSGPSVQAWRSCRVLINIARKLDIRIVAEGVETEVQASQLWTVGCRLGWISPLKSRTPCRP
ncbi:EAL domain-containing protein [Pseudomonas citronellolis]|nr:EAL domain-containing protein [Pseudomonas citronellolis]